MKKISLLFGFLAMFLVSVNLVDAKVSGVSNVINLKIKSAPTKISYTVGDKLDLSGLVVTSTTPASSLISGISNTIGNESTSIDIPFANFNTNKITTSITNGKILKVSDSQVIIKSSKGLVVQPITVKAIPKTFSISIVSIPTKTSYVVGDALDLNGLVVKILKTDGSTTDVPFKISTISTDGVKIINPFITNNITTSKLNGSILTEKDNKILVKIDGKASASFDILVSVNIACVKPQLEKRESSIALVYDNYATSIKTALTKRTASLVLGWSLEKTIDRNNAIKLAWSTFKSEQKKLQTIRKNEVKKAWTIWSNDLKICKVSSILENQVSDLQ